MTGVFPFSSLTILLIFHPSTSERNELALVSLSFFWMTTHFDLLIKCIEKESPSGTQKGM